MSFLDVKDVHKGYAGQNVLKGVSFSLDPEEHLVIRGASGSGKSTLLYLLGGLDHPDQGEIRLGDQRLGDLGDEALAHYRGSRVGFIFQFHFLLGSMKCWDNILLPSRLGGAANQAIEERCHQMALALRVEHCLQKYPYQLSGGEQQRVNIVRALSLRPRLILCDEPTGNLDAHNTERVIELIAGLTREIRACLIVATHDPQVAAHFGRRVHIEDGVLSEGERGPMEITRS